MVRNTRSSHRRHRRQRGSLGTVGAVAALGVLLVVVALLVRAVDRPTNTASRPPPVPPTASKAALPEPSAAERTAGDQHWASVLDAIGRRRAVAWAHGRPELLSRVYTVGSAVLREDRELIADYAARGLRVVGADLRIASVAVTHRAGRSVDLLVVDRLGAATAVDQSGHRRRLPRDLPTRHRIELRLVGDQWRIARVTPA